MSIVPLFQYQEQPVRTVIIDDELWFLGTDVAKILGYQKAYNMAQLLDEDEKKTLKASDGTLSAIRGYLDPLLSYILINESGVYHAVFKSEKPNAQGFRKWVTGTVLPEIRRTGSFNAKPQPQTEALELAAKVSTVVADAYERVAKYNPRIAQMIADHAANQLLLPTTTHSTPVLRGVVEIAESLGYKVDISTRIKLGKYVAKVLGTAQTEERLCNGRLTPIKVYEDTPEVRDLITDYLTAQAA